MLASRNSTVFYLLYAAELYNYFERTTQKTQSVVKEACLLIRYVAVDVLLLCAFASAAVYLPSRCLAMGIHVTLCRI
jgi:hypothetical protein